MTDTPATDIRAGFELHDVSTFPFVHATARERQFGVAPQWQREMEMLIDRNEPFVILFPPHHHGGMDDLQGEERQRAQLELKQRTLWLKQNRQALGRVCRGLIAVEPDAVRRALEQAKAAMLEKVFGVPLKVSGSTQDAEALGNRLLGKP